MKEELELIDHIHKDASMAVHSIHTVLEELKDCDNKIKESLEEILDEYKDYVYESKKELEEHDIKPAEESFIAKMSADMGITKDIKKDNSDSAIADMMIKGITMGTVDMEKKINEYEDIVDNKHKKMAHDFLKFQEKSIKELKEYL